MTRGTDTVETMPMQASAVPVRYRGNELEFCLITTSAGRWNFPKGVVEPGETSDEAALKEAFEEAGLHGKILGSPLGSYELPKLRTTFDVTVVLMRVKKCDRKWQEQHMRRRCWVTADEARKLLKRPHLQEFVDAAANRMK